MLQYEEDILIKKVKEGDEKAFEILISAYEKKIYSIAFHTLKNPQEAYDASQEICIKVWRQIHNFEGQSKFSTWIYRISVNQCLDIIRKNKNHSKNISLFNDDKEDIKVEFKIPAKDNVEEAIEKKELSQVIELAVSELKEDYRVIITLRDIEEQSYEDIANVLEISLGTVKSRISRARQSLRKILGQNKEPYRSFFRHIK